VYNLIDSLASFLDINRYSPHNTTQPKFLVDLLPEVYCGSSDGRLRQLLLRAFHDPKKVENMLQRVDAQGSVYLPSINALYVRDFQMMYTAEEVARFLHHACRGLPLHRGRNPSSVPDSVKDRFYARTVEHALARFGSRVLYPVNLDVSDPDPLNCTKHTCERLAHEAIAGNRQCFDLNAQHLGNSLGNGLYDTYLRGSLSRTIVRHLFLAHIEQPGKAQVVCREIVRHIGSSHKKPCGSVR
jgi:hypothetical protein